MSSFVTLGDFLPQSEVKCRIRGCNNMVQISGETAMHNIASGKNPHKARLCDECFKTLQTLQDKEMPCSKQGCDGTWIWTRYQQLEAIKSGKGESYQPHGFCDKCREEMKNIGDEQIPCRIKGCKNTWTLTAREKMSLNGKATPHKMCDECYALLQKLEDKQIPCRVRGCKHTWTWNRFQQIEHLRSGESLDKPPMRMCEDCIKVYKELTPQNVPCRIRGCEHTWVWTPFEQLEAIIAAKEKGDVVQSPPADSASSGPASPAPLPEPTPENAVAAPAEQEASKTQLPPPPRRMCKECYTLWSTAKDIEVACKNPGCHNTWLYTRSMQLTQKQRGKTNPPARYCAECTAKLETLQEKDMPCDVPGCTGTWRYLKDEQLRDLSLNRTPKNRRCPQCSEFLRNTPQEKVACAECGKEFTIPSMLLLQCKLSQATKPTLCADCTKKKLQDVIAQNEPTDSIVRPAIYIPANGPWSASSISATPPADLTPAKIAEMASATCRIVCLGDQMSLSHTPVIKAWPELLAANLTDKLQKPGILNASLADSTTAHALLRFDRDVTPFQPQFVIFSFILADTLAAPAAQNDLDGYLENLGKDIEALLLKIKETGARPIIWTGTPILFQNAPRASQIPSWSENFAATMESVLRITRKTAEQQQALLIDTKALFSIAGEQAATKWMADWCHTNETGMANIANWIKDQLCVQELTKDVPPLQK